MKIADFQEKACDRMRRYFDSYMDDELLVETNHELLRHLESCPACAAEIEGRSRLKQAVRAAALAEQAPPDLLAGVRRSVQQGARSFSPPYRGKMLLLAASLILAASLVLRFPGGAPPPGGPAGTLHEAAEMRAREILSWGIANHVHCVLNAGAGAPSPTARVEEPVGAPPPPETGFTFSDLVRLVQEHAGPRLRLVAAHRCRTAGRGYLHLVFYDGAQAVSVTLTERQGLVFPQADAAGHEDAHLHQDRQQDLEVAGFETGRYFVFVVSKLDPASNLQVARVLAPPVSRMLSGTAANWRREREGA